MTVLPSQQAYSHGLPLCAELAKCFVPLKRFEMTVKLLRKLIISTRTTRAYYFRKCYQLFMLKQSSAYELSSLNILLALSVLFFQLFAIYFT